MSLRLRPLGGQPVIVRPRSADQFALDDAFVGRYHLPPPELAGEQLDVIWDLGANIGLTMAHFARLYPQAVVIGLELDADNAELCGRNTAAWGDRCEIVHAAVWTEDGEVEYQRTRGEELSF